MEIPRIFRKPQGLQIRSYVTHCRKICESAWCLHDTWISKSSSSLSKPSKNLSKNLSKSGEIVKPMGSHRKLGKFESPSSSPRPWLKKNTSGIPLFLGRWLPRSFCCPCQGETLNFLQSDAGICEVKCPPIQTPSVSVSSFKPELI